MNKYAVAGIVSLALTEFAQGAAAQATAAKAAGPVTHWYIGAGLGEDYASIPESTLDAINSALLSQVAGATSSTIDKSKRTTGAKAFLGYSFNRYLAVEAGYAPLGTSSASFTVYNNANTSVGNYNLDYKMTAAYIDAVGMFPLSAIWSLFGRVGAAYGRTDLNQSGSVMLILSSNDQSESTVRAKFGAGVDYNLNPAFTVRAEWELYKMPDPLSTDLFDVNAATLSLIYRF